MYHEDFFYQFTRIKMTTHREILLNQTEIRLYLPYSDLFGTVNGQRPFAFSNQSENSKYNLISV